MTDRPNGFIRALLRQRLGMLAAGWLLLVLLGALAAPVLAPYGSDDADLAHALDGPGRQHLLGVDPLGRDVLSRLLYGAPITLEGVLLAVAVFVLIGTALGLVAGYFGGRADWLISHLTDLVLAIPAVVILLVVLSIFPVNRFAPMLAFGLLAAPGLLRVVRAAALSIREEAYIDAARTFGIGPIRIMARHLLPRMASQIVVQTAVFAGVALVVQSGLAFLGFGPRPPAPSWGGAVADASGVISRDRWLLVPSGAVIALTVLALGLLGDAVRDASTQRWSAAAAGPGRRSSARRQPRRRSAGRQPAADRSSALLAVRGLTVEFDSPAGPVQLVNEVSFELEAGQSLGVVGESGCGKTMTAMAVLGLLPAGVRVSAGTVQFDGHDLAALDTSALARLRGREIGYVSQEPMIALDPTFTVGSQLAEAARRHHGLSRPAARQRALQLLARVRLPEPAVVSASYPHQLSGGIAQRAAIALALAGEPRLLIADEPTTALDVSVQAEILALLHELRRETGLAVLLISHDWGVIADLCERAVVMYAGQVVESCELAGLFADPRHPYTAALLAANPQLAGAGVARIGVPPLPLPTITGTVPAAADWPVSCHFADRCPLVRADCRQDAITLIELAGGRQCRCVLVRNDPERVR
ncbi:MAG: dipeptide/oligopeptide/nickel ABC transporter permease/ATP-binding protein [Jatrophihabitantaceae bacterium]